MLLTIAKEFSTLGIGAFGGPIAHVSVMRRRFVDELEWLSDGEFSDLFALSQLLPGPNSTELAMQIGYRKAGQLGLFVAGLCFILPAFFLVLLASFLYIRYQSMPNFEPLMSWVRPTVAAIIFHAVVSFARQTLKSKAAIALTAAALIACFARIPDVGILVACAIVAWLLTVRPSSKKTRALEPISLAALFWSFLQIGSLLFGSGYVLFSYLNQYFVIDKNLLTAIQITDAIALGQITPGPLFSSATFVGYLLKGTLGAVVATVGIFAPAFFIVAITAPLLQKLKDATWLRSSMIGLHSASLALVAFALVDLGKAALLDFQTCAVFAVGIGLLFFTRISSTLLMGLALLTGIFT